ncbi:MULTISPECIES: hypothetical protein [Pseudomonas]|nr:MULTISPECIES: hypothetical protein [Pseudomonas]MBT2341104.1 hypothetical protein [Pseudomonas fluorescens]MCD4531826.1 hypothetical protein [Pseudomonas sp. C3-2018]
MSEYLLALSGDFDSELKRYQPLNSLGIDSVHVSIVECGTVHCTAILC